MNHIYIGYDNREHDAYLVARHSIELRSSVPVLITPLHFNLVARYIAAPIRRGESMWDLESDAPQSTEFARSRFCVPKLQHQGWALFMDCDMLVTADIAELFALADEKYAVMVVKHGHVEGVDTKMDGQKQLYYARKNWSSVILWNCSHPAHHRLTDMRLNMWPGRDLHAFKWLEDSEIGELPSAWNHLVDVQEPEDAKILHYTLGCPNMDGYESCGFSELWLEEYGKVRKHTAAHRKHLVAGS